MHSKYSILNNEKINNWTNELRISKEYNKSKNNIIIILIKKYSLLHIITATDNRLINREPARILIDKRLDKVIVWNNKEKDSNINRIIKNTSILVKNRYNRYDIIIKPK